MNTTTDYVLGCMRHTFNIREAAGAGYRSQPSPKERGAEALRDKQAQAARKSFRVID